MAIRHDFMAIIGQKKLKDDQGSRAKETSRRLSENALFPKLFVMPKKIILGISTICLW